MKIIDKFLQEERSFEKKDSVKAVISCPDGKILILRRQGNGDDGDGKWDFPGGCIEKGETNSEALKRETFEEAGIKIDKIRKIKSVIFKIPEQGVNSTMHVFSAETLDLDVKLKPATWEGSDGKPEHTQYQWVSKLEEVENIPMIDQLKKILLSKVSSKKL